MEATTKLQELEKEFCPPLDDALLYAITSDYDLSDATVVDELRTLLEPLRASALAVEAAAFDPSGSSGVAAPPQLDGAAADDSSPERAQSWNGDAKSKSTETSELSDVTRSLRSWSIGQDLDSDAGGHRQHAARDAAAADAAAAADDDALPAAEKELLIREMFPTLRAFDVAFALKKNRAHFARTVEELLNHVFLAEECDSAGETQTPPRGIDAFASNASASASASSSSSARRNRARAKKRKKAASTALSRQRSSSLPSAYHPEQQQQQQQASTTTTTPTPTRSAWDAARQDVDWIAQRTCVPATLLASLYHRCGASLAATLHALCATPVADLPANPYVDALDDDGDDDDDALVQAHALDLRHHFPRLPLAALATLVYLTHPSTASAHELARRMGAAAFPSAAAAAAAAAATPLTPTYARPSGPSLDSPVEAPFRLPKTRKVLPSISAAALRSAPNPSRLPVAAIDLHHLTVSEAKAATLRHLDAWWESPGVREFAREGKVMGGEERGFQIVTGVGRHSEGGRGKLGPAVGGMLVRGGWRVSFGEGVLLVMGRRRG